MPAPIIAMFKQGAFVVSIKGRAWHSVAIDEAHEMLVNKDCKSAVVRPLPDYINRIARYLPYRSKSLQNLKDQLIPSRHVLHPQSPLHLMMLRAMQIYMHR